MFCQYVQVDLHWQLKYSMELAAHLKLSLRVLDAEDQEVVELSVRPRSKAVFVCICAHRKIAKLQVVRSTVLQFHLYGKRRYSFSLTVMEFALLFT